MTRSQQTLSTFLKLFSAGTGGTLTGIARKLKERCPDCIVIGVDPKGSILAEPEPLNDENRLQSYQVEGVGYDFIVSILCRVPQSQTKPPFKLNNPNHTHHLQPTVCERALVDRWIKTGDRESFIMSRRLIREEGLLCGGSSGGNVVAALQAAAELEEGQKCVVILPDSVRNYMTKFLSDDWMWRFGHVDEARGIGVGEARDGAAWEAATVAELHVPRPVTVTPAVTCAEAVDILAGQGFDQLPVVAEDGTILGVVTSGNLTSKLASGRVSAGDSVTEAAYKQFRKVQNSTTLGDLARIFDLDHFALVTSSQTQYSGKASPVERTIVSGVVSRINLLRYITANSGEGAAGAGAGEA